MSARSSSLLSGVALNGGSFLTFLHIIDSISTVALRISLWRSVNDHHGLFLINLQKPCNLKKKRLTYFPVKFTIFLRTPTLKNTCERLLLTDKLRMYLYKNNLLISIVTREFIIYWKQEYYQLRVTKEFYLDIWEWFS